jgi:phasin family protein
MRGWVLPFPCQLWGIMMFNNFDDFQKLNKNHVELMMKSFGAYSRGLQAIAVEVADHSKKSFEDGTATLEKLIGAKTLDRAIEVQSNFVKDSYEAYVSRATKIGELAADTAKEAYKPYESALQNNNTRAA